MCFSGRALPAIVCALFLAGLAAVALAAETPAAPAAPAATEGRPASAIPNVNMLTDAEKAAGWVLLFDGKTTAGWRNFKKQDVSAGWQVIDGALCRVDKTAGDIITVAQYDNFVLELDYKVPEHANSGIMYRVSEEQARAPFTGVRGVRCFSPDGAKGAADWGSSYCRVAVTVSRRVNISGHPQHGPDGFRP